MNKKAKLLNVVKDYLKTSKEFFAQKQQAIANENMKALRKMSVFYLFCLVAYYLSVCQIDQSPLQRMCVIAAMALQLVLIGCVQLYSRAHTYNYYVVEYSCVVFGLMINALTIALGTAVFPEVPALMFPLMLICMTQIYTLPTRITAVMLLVYSATFLIFSFSLKDFQVFFSDIVATVAALMIAYIAHFTIMHYKLRDFKTNSDLQKLCSIDAMTGVWNKSTFSYYYDEFIRSPEQDDPYLLAVIDVDRFKLINDRYGHSFGDDALLTLVAILREYFAPQGDNALLGRFGGDEFVLLLKSVQDEAAAGRCIKQLAEFITEQMLARLDAEVTCSIGGSYATDSLGFQLMFQCADRAMYETKSKQSGCASLINADRTVSRPIMLIAHHEQDTRAMLRGCFEDSYTVFETSDGAQTTDVIARYADRLAVILMELELPEPTGRELLQRINGEPQTAAIPVVVVTTDERAALKADELGARDILCIPSAPQDIRECVFNATRAGV